jgi:hypothetical protein
MGCRTAVLLVVLALAGPAAAADEDLPTVEEIEKYMRAIQSHVKNANLRVKNGMAGVSSEDGASAQGRPPTPAEACCSSNLEHVRESIAGLSKALDRTYRHYAEQGNADAVARLEAVRQPLQAVAAGMAQFKMAGTQGRAIEALQGVVRPFLELRAAVAELGACCLRAEDPGRE